MRRVHPIDALCLLMLAALSLVIALDDVLLATSPAIDIRQPASESYAVVSPDGAVVSTHATRRVAEEVASNLALANPGAEYRITMPALVVTAEGVEPPPAPAPRERVIYTWFEANSQSWLDVYLLHAADWPGTPIMTARGHNAVSHTQQCLDVGLPIITGFKTSDFLRGKPLHDPEAWSEIAALARELSAMTDGRPIVIDNEGAVKLWREAGGEVVDYAALLAAIEAQEWPEMWWWYSPLGAGEPLRSISLDIARAVTVGMPNARLIEPHSSGYKRSPAWLNNAANAETLRLNTRLTYALDPDALAIIYLDDTAANFWPLVECSVAVGQAPEDVIIYPGLGDLERAADIGGAE